MVSFRNKRLAAAAGQEFAARGAFEDVSGVDCRSELHWSSFRDVKPDSMSSGPSSFGQRDQRLECVRRGQIGLVDLIAPCRYSVQNKVDAAQNRPTERDALSAKSLIRPLNLAHLTVYFIMRLRNSIDPGIEISKGKCPQDKRSPHTGEVAWDSRIWREC